MAGLEVARFLHEPFQSDELVAHLRQPTREGRALRTEPTRAMRVPAVAPDRLRVPGVGGQLPRESEAVDRGDDAAHLGRVHARVAFAQVDPPVDANLRAAQVGQHASVSGADDRRRRDAGGVGRLLVVGVLSTSSSGIGSNCSFTANVPSVVESRQTWPISPRATGPESVASSPSENRSATSVAPRVSDIEHRGSIGGPEEGVRDLHEGLAWMETSVEGRDWLARLPGLVDACAEAWSLTLGEPFPYAFASLALPATREDGSAAVLEDPVPRP